MSHSNILVWPFGRARPVVAKHLATLSDAEDRRFIRFEHNGEVLIAPEGAVTRLDRLFPKMTGAEISPDYGTA